MKIFFYLVVLEKKGNVISARARDESSNQFHFSQSIMFMMNIEIVIAGSVIEKFFRSRILVIKLGGTTIRTHDISYTRHLVQKPKLDISYKSETRHFVQKRNRTFRAIYIIQLC